MRFLATYIMRGRMQAVVAVAVFMLLSFVLPPLSILSASAVSLVSLRGGQREGMITIMGAALAVGILGQGLLGSSGFVVAYALGFWLPVWIFAVLLRVSGQLGFTLEVGLGLGLVAIVAIYLFGSDPAVMWQERLGMILEPLAANPPPGVELGQIETSIQAVSHYMTGILVTGTIVSLVLAMLVGRWWQAMLYNPGGFREEFLSLRPRSAVAYIFLGVFLLAGMENGLLSEGMRNACILGFFFYLIIGVSVVHVLISATRMKGILLPAMYILMFFVPWALLPVALAGYTDAWMNWRARVLAN